MNLDFQPSILIVSYPSTMGDAIAQNVDVQSGIRVTAVGSSAPRAYVRPFEPVRTPTDSRLVALTRDMSQVSSARLGQASGLAKYLSGATLIALRAKRSGEWEMTLSWEDVDTFADAHANAPLQGWFETPDSPMLVVDLASLR